MGQEENAKKIAFRLGKDFDQRVSREKNGDRGKTIVRWRGGQSVNFTVGAEIVITLRNLRGYAILGLIWPMCIV